MSQMMDEPLKSSFEEFMPWIQEHNDKLKTGGQNWEILAEQTEEQVKDMNKWIKTWDLETPEEFLDIMRGIMELPNEKRFKITTEYEGDFSGPSGPSGGSSRPAEAKKTGAFAQRGADFIVPPGYPNDSFRLNVTSGERVYVQPAAEVGRAPAGNQMNTFNIYGATNPRAVADEIARKLKMQGVGVR